MNYGSDRHEAIVHPGTKFKQTVYALIHKEADSNEETLDGAIRWIGDVEHGHRYEIHRAQCDDGVFRPTYWYSSKVGGRKRETVSISRKQRFTALRALIGDASSTCRNRLGPAGVCKAFFSMGIQRVADEIEQSARMRQRPGADHRYTGACPIHCINAAYMIGGSWVIMPNLLQRPQGANAM